MLQISAHPQNKWELMAGLFYIKLRGSEGWHHLLSVQNDKTNTTWIMRSKIITEHNRRCCLLGLGTNRKSGKAQLIKKVNSSVLYFFKVHGCSGWKFIHSWTTSAATSCLPSVIKTWCLFLEPDNSISIDALSQIILCLIYTRLPDTWLSPAWFTNVKLYLKKSMLIHNYKCTFLYCYTHNYIYI